MERYSDTEKLGEGAFSVVLKGRDGLTGKEVALKKIWLTNQRGLSETEIFPTPVIRELKALQQLEHPNVIKLLDFFAHGSALVLVTEFMLLDLQDLLQHCRQFLSQGHIKTIVTMLLQGVAFCHSMNIMHRDLKPANLLIGPGGILKIADFGLARVFDSVDHDAMYSHQVATRWYRSPELLFGSRQYTTEADMWAVGCILGELLNHSPLFPGENDIDQLFHVLRVLGTPTEQTWPGSGKLPDYNKIVFDAMPAVPLAEVLPNAPAEAISLLSRLLVYPPSSRISAAEALRDPYFFTEPLPSPPSELLSLAHKVRAKPFEKEAVATWTWADLDLASKV
eukprot:gnl/Hemi2/18029_TR5956_c0_g1_i1.p1 gnl/Hemi2/18029_TR5956_c0_g1~~gnl/Hemi2/18029_TR5956_c0_g1_i1.p1  ORF type:complete len:337 (-),score=82.36 gnl/Hemi2/18029_TR5956_c0_g1_i1:79-1089(-)